VFTPFFYKLKEKKVPVSITEWMMLIEALSKSCATDLNEFYYLARSILVKSETYYDQYDLAFQEYFNGITPPLEITEELLSWPWISRTCSRSSRKGSRSRPSATMEATTGSAPAAYRPSDTAAIIQAASV